MPVGEVGEAQFILETRLDFGINKADIMSIRDGGFLTILLNPAAIFLPGLTFHSLLAQKPCQFFHNQRYYACGGTCSISIRSSVLFPE